MLGLSCIKESLIELAASMRRRSAALCTGTALSHTGAEEGDLRVARTAQIHHNSTARRPSCYDQLGDCSWSTSPPSRRRETAGRVTCTTHRCRPRPRPQWHGSGRPDPSMTNWPSPPDPKATTTASAALAITAARQNHRIRAGRRPPPQPVSQNCSPEYSADKTQPARPPLRLAGAMADQRRSPSPPSPPRAATATCRWLHTRIAKQQCTAAAEAPPRSPHRGRVERRPPPSAPRGLCPAAHAGGGGEG